MALWRGLAAVQSLKDCRDRADVPGLRIINDLKVEELEADLGRRHKTIELTIICRCRL